MRSTSFVSDSERTLQWPVLGNVAAGSENSSQSTLETFLILSFLVDLYVCKKAK